MASRTSSSSPEEAAVALELVRSDSAASEEQPMTTKTYGIISLLILITIPMGYLISTNVFISDSMPFMCYQGSENLTEVEGYQFYDGRHFLPNERLNELTRKEIEADQKLFAKGQCQTRDGATSSHNQTCDQMVFYNKLGVKPGQRTLRMSYDLICGREWLLPTTTTAGFLGNAIGSLVGGRLSDKYGRKPLYISSLYLQILFVYGTSISPNVTCYLIAIFCAVFCQMISYQVGIVILSELCTRNRMRSWLQCIYGLIFSIGVVLLPVAAYFFPDWRQIMLIAALMRLLSIPYFWLVPESWKWQRAKQIRDMESKNLLEKTSKDKKDKGDEQTTEEGFAALLGHREARRRLAVISIAWLLQSYSYYGMNINSTNLSSEHIYYNAILTAFVDMPAAFISIGIVEFFGKRKSFLGSIAISFCVLLLGLVFKNSEHLDQNYQGVFANSMIFGKMMLCNITNLLWMYVQDLFPTSVRNTAVGIAAFCAQMGSCIAPYIVELGRNDPNILYGSCLGISAFVFLLVLTLPETDADKLPDTLDQI